MNGYEVECSECGLVGSLRDPLEPGEVALCDSCIDRGLLRAVIEKALWLRPCAGIPSGYEPEIPDSMTRALEEARTPN